MVTFFLACVLCGAVTIGLLVAIAAGIAYGYNYSMAEFLTFTKQDVTVYMRRGQFYDRPDIDLDRDMYSRRSDGGEVEQPQSGDNYNKSTDYQVFHAMPDANYQEQHVKPEVNYQEQRATPEVNYQEQRTKVEEAKMLSKNWENIKDTNIFSDVLTRIQSHTMPDTEEPEDRAHEPSILPKPISVTPNPLLHTTVLRSGSSKIVLRNFRPGEVINYNAGVPKQQNDEFFYPDADERNTKARIDYIVEKETAPRDPDIRMRAQNPLRTQSRLRQWRTTKISFRDDLIEPDDDNAVYKPV